MAIYPKIQSPCPYKGNIADILDGEVCRLCKREVFDLTAMSDGERVAFMQGCNGAEVCVRYSIRPALAAAALAAAIAAPSAAAACDSVQMNEVVVVGGIKKPSEVRFVEAGEAASDRAIPLLPVVYDNPPSKPAPAVITHDAPAAPVARPASP